MIIRALAVAAALLAAGTGGAALAEPMQLLGWGRIFSNDGLGDGQDRWRTGAYTVSLLRGRGWSGDLPPALGELLEFRARAEIIAPANLSRPAAGDRRYAGVLSFGLHSHARLAGFDTSLGLDLAVTGPQTGLDDFQRAMHDLLGAAAPQAALGQIGDAVHPTLLAEIGRSLPLGSAAELRPFVEAQAGLETYVRLGADLTLGRYGQGALMLREATTGQRYRALADDPSPGFTLVLGGDIAHVWDSALLPGGEAAVLKDSRSRLRAGLAWQGRGGASGFYGLSWLSEEFEGQTEGQLVGSLSLALIF